MAEFERVMQAAMRKYARGVSNETIQRSVILSMLKKKGRISTKESGKDMDWAVKYRQTALVGTSDMEAYTFQRENQYRRLVLDWRGARIGGVISDKERRMVRGKEKLIDIWGPKLETLREDAEDQLNKWMLYDGNATGYEKHFHGLKSIMAYSTSTATVQYGTCNETYGGQTLNAVYPTESDASAYSPKHVNEKYSAYGSWTTSGTKILRALISACTVANEPSARPDVAITTEARYLAFKNLLASEERYQVGAKDLKTLSAGFEGVRYDGLELTWDADWSGIMGNSTMCLNFNKMKLRLLTDELFEGDSEYDIHRKAYLYDLITWGNLEISPRYFGWSKDLTAAFA
jgi:hypothetical protein